MYVVYVRRVDDGLSRTLTTMLPLPAARVGHDWIRIRSVRLLGEKREGSFDELLDALISHSAMQQLAKQEGIEATTQDLERARASVIGSPARFGWSTRAFEAQVVRPLALLYALERWASDDVEAQAPVRARTQDAVARLEHGDDFASVAGDMSDDRSAMFGGDLGFLDEALLPDDWKQTIAELVEGEVSGIIETPSSFDVLRLLQRIEASGAVGVHVKVSVIQFQKATFEQVLEQYLDALPIAKFFP